MSSQYPIDSDGFSCSFSDPNDWLTMMKKYNVIVVPILENSECDEVIEDLWRFVGPKITSDYSTWATENWPDPDHPSLCNRYVTTERAFLTRTHPKLVRVFEALYGTINLTSTIDHYGIKRGTILPDGSNRKEWRNKPLRLHWDCDVHEYLRDKKPRYQALLALNENSVETGSFACVPSSANLLKEWVSLYENPESRKYVPLNNPWQKLVQRLPLRKGSMVVWDMGVAHANFSNHSAEARLTMYCRMIPKEPWAIDRDDQNLFNYWKQNPKIKKAVCQYRQWSKREKELLCL
jgi:hypothetical protein